MKQHRSLAKRLLVASLTGFVGISSFSSCDSPAGLTSQRQEQDLISLRVNLIPGASALASSIIQIVDLSALPAAIQNSSQLKVIFDDSKATVQVQKLADGTWSFPFQSARSFDSDNQLTVLFVADNGQTFPVRLQTGTPFKLTNNPIAVLPSNNVSLGTRLSLKANLTQAALSEQYLFAWEIATSAAGPWQTLSGNLNEINWLPTQSGAYFVRLTMTDRKTQAISNYLSPGPVVYVQALEQIAKTQPLSGRITSGEKIQLSANLPEFDASNSSRLQWFYGLSPQGPFSPISGQGAKVTWEPPFAGSFYLRIQSEENGQISSYTSAKAQVLVASPDDMIVTEPASGDILRGQSIKLSATLANSSPDTSYSWFYSFSPQGPFSPIAGSGKEIDWSPPLTGDFYIRLRTFDPLTSQSQTYTSGQSEVSVRDSNNTFSLQPESGSILKGASVQVTLNDDSSTQVSWSYSSSLQSAFSPIADTGKNIQFTPPEAGSYYLRATVTRADGSNASFTSAEPIVFVAERANVLRTDPAQANIQLGQPVTLRADLGLSGGFKFNWSYSTSASGPFSPVQSLETAPLSGVTWYPPNAGSFFVKVDVNNPDSQSTVSFTSQEPIVRVTESVPLFSTDPVSGRIEPDDDVLIKSAFDPKGRSFNFGWAYSRSSAGPFIPLGGSSNPEFLWEDQSKPSGSYYVRLQATAPGSDRSLNFVSSYPILFVSDNAGTGNEFGLP